MNRGAHHAEILLQQVAFDAKPQLTIDLNDTAFDAANHIIGIYIAVARANEGGLNLGDDDNMFTMTIRPPNFGGNGCRVSS